MSYQPTPKQTLFLWYLLAKGGGEFLKNVKMKLDPTKDRKPLVEAGLIEEDKRKESQAKKGARAILHFSLTEKGWEWTASHMDAEISTSQAAAPVLHKILAKLHVFLETHHISLADFITAPAEEEKAPDVRGRIRDAYGKLAEGKWNTRVRLADLRDALPDIAGEDLDRALLGMEGDGAVVLFPLDNPQEIRPEDERAALRNAAGFPRHVMYMEG